MNNSNTNSDNGAPAAASTHLTTSATPATPTTTPANSATNDFFIEMPTTSMGSPGNQGNQAFLFGTDEANASGSTLQRNLLSIFSRSQLGRQTSMPNPNPASGGQQTDALAGHINDTHSIMRANSESGFGQMRLPSSSQQQQPLHHHHHHRHGHAVRNMRASWRTNLNNVFSFSSSPSTDALRSLITNTGNFRYSPLNIEAGLSGRNDTALLLQNTDDHDEHNAHAHGDGATTNPRLSQSVREISTAENNEMVAPLNAGGASDAGPPVDINRPGIMRQFSNRSGQQQQQQQAQEPQQPDEAAGDGRMDDENNLITDMAVQMLSHFVRYIPFVCLLFVKFIHDHFLGILDIVWLHAVMYHANKSLRQQVAKFSQRNYAILLRDFVLVLLFVSYRLAVSSAPPDPFGLLVNIPNNVAANYNVLHTKSPDNLNTDDSSDYLKGFGNDKSLVNVGTLPPVGASIVEPVVHTVTITKSLPLGTLLFYVAVNDLILKLITILMKLAVTFMPTKMLRHKSRARLYVLIEYLSQFYRSMAPVRQWYTYLIESYSGLEVISGIIFLVLYFGAKVFEFVERGKSLKKAFMNFIQNMDYERKPTKDELETAGNVCPICHDAYNSPVILNCSHIFCDDCVSTWFKREQTCPMCRAKVSEDPTWQDGATTFFYQLC